MTAVRLGVRAGVRSSRSISPPVAGMLLLVVLAAGGSDGCTRPAPRSHQVTVRSFTYQADPVYVARGDTVVWVNADMVPHTVTARDGRWDSQSLVPSASWRLIAEEAGRYQYFCVFHPSMEGTLVVR